MMCIDINMEGKYKKGGVSKKEKGTKDHEFKMDVKMFSLPQAYFLVDTRRRSNVNTTSYDIYDVVLTLK